MALARSVRTSSTRGTRGFAAMFVVALVPMLGFAALVVDIGTLQVARGQLQASLDAAALAAVGHLDGTDAGVTKARAAARAFAAKNPVLNAPVALASSDVAFGTFDAETGRFVAASDPRAIDAVEVTHRHTGFATFLANVAFGVDALDLAAASLARTGNVSSAGTVDCFLPLAVPDCMLEDKSVFESYALRMSSANVDNTGWANPFGSVNAEQVTSQLQGQCDQGTIGVGDPVNLGNGQLTSAYQTLQDLMLASPDYWQADKWGALPPRMPGSTMPLLRYGRVVQGPVIVFDGGDATCGSAMQFNGSRPITGFAWAVIYDVDDHGSDKNLRVRLDATWEYEVGSGMGGHPDGNVTFQDDHILVY